MTSPRDPAALLTRLHGQLIVSCQATDGHPLRDTPTMVRMAQAAVDGGAAGIRCGGYGGLADIQAVAAAVDVPVIGLTKDGTEGVYITPTVRAALSVVHAGADIVAVDATARPRPDGKKFSDTVEAVHRAGALVMADIACLAEGIAALAAGANLIGTTLAGYTGPDPRPDGPDLELVAELRKALPHAFLIAEGRIHSPQLAADALAAGASAVVVGTAITDPAWITRQYVRSVLT